MLLLTVILIGFPNLTSIYLEITFVCIQK